MGEGLSKSMRIAIDTHTHTVASGHAYSTVYELAMGARKARLKGLADALRHAGIDGSLG